MSRKPAWLGLELELEFEQFSSCCCSSERVRLLKDQRVQQLLLLLAVEDQTGDEVAAEVEEL